MSKTELKATLASLLTDCSTYVDNELSVLRARASDYYRGLPFGNEEEGRSQVVLTEVRDGIQGVMPSLLKVFHGPERIVEFVPRGPKGVEIAAQASDYINYVYVEDNAGFLTTHSVLKDGLLKKLGIAKWGWDDTSATTAHRLVNVTQEQLELLGGDPEVELTEVETDPQTQLSEVELTRTTKEGRARVYALPPEEFLSSRAARSIDEALLIGHRTRKSRGELLAMGIKKKDLDEFGGVDASLQSNVEEIARGLLYAAVPVDVEAGEANDLILYVEAYPYLDYDGDGIAELRKICTIGPSYHPISNDPADARPFAVFCPDPEPHTLIGQSWADRLMDMQRIKSFVLRSTLDSLALSLNPRTVIVEGKVNVQDAMNTDLGAIIRAKDVGMVMPFTHPFVGQDALPVLQMLDEVIERRTGQNKGTLGLDADALQSTGKEGVNAAINSSQAQTELLARIFAEQFLKPLFRGMLKLLCEHQPSARMVRLRDQWVPVDPREWDSDMDVTVNVALGSTLIEQKVQTLDGIAGEQKDILATLGPGNPLVGMDQYRNTLARMVELRGFKDTASFFKPVPSGWQPPPPPPPQPPQMDPADAAKMQLEGQKAQTDLQQAQAELQFKQMSSMQDNQFREVQLAQTLQIEREKMESAQQIAYETLKVNSATELQVAQARLALEHERTLAMHAADLAQAEREGQRASGAEDAAAHREHVLALAAAEREERDAARTAQHEHESAMMTAQAANIAATQKPEAKAAPAPAAAPAVAAPVAAPAPAKRTHKIVRDPKTNLITSIQEV